jgi:hypothetical protein
VSSLAELFDEMERRSRVVNWYYALRRTPSNLRRSWREFREFFVRGHHGWAMSDAWDLDHYLARVMGESISFLAESTHGWPGEGSEWATFEEWQDELRTHAKALIRYGENRIDDWEFDIGPTIARLSTFWGHLWD